MDHLSIYQFDFITSMVKTSKMDGMSSIFCIKKYQTPSIIAKQQCIISEMLKDYFFTQYGLRGASIIVIFKNNFEVTHMFFKVQLLN
jgi:hypothetical protein